MFSILKQLLGGGGAAAAAAAGEPGAVREIARQLETLPAERARFVACFAYLLGRVARVEQGVSEEETLEMERRVHELGELPPAQAALAVRIAVRQGELFAATEDYLVSREFLEVSTPAQRRQLLDCLFAISAADDAISAAEEATIRQMTSELRLSHEDFIAARLAYTEKRTVTRLLREGGSPP